MYPEAEAELRSLGKLKGQNGDAKALLVRGMADPAQRVAAVNSLETSPDNADIRQDAIWYAFYLISLGERGRALDELEIYAVKHNSAFAGWLWNRGFDPLRDEPRFKAVLAKLALALHPACRHRAMSDKRSFFSELKRRNVYKVAVAYVVVAWLLIQAASILFPTFDAPAWVMKVFVVVIVLCFPVALVCSWAFEITPEGIKRESDIDPGKSSTARTGRRIVSLTVVLAVIAAALFIFQLFRSKILTTTTSSVASIASAVSAKSVAVLPLVNTSGDPSNEYFSDGLSEELIAVLAKIPDLKVIGRSSSFLFKGKSGDSGAIGQKLGVAHLIEGSVRKQGERVRIVAELINAADGRSLWSETYDRELKDMFAVQDEIATAVAEQMKVSC